MTLATELHVEEHKCSREGSSLFHEANGPQSLCHPPIHVPAIVMEKTPNSTVFVVRRKHVHYTNNRTIQPCSIPSGRHLPGHKTDTATIRAITIYGVTCQLVWRCHPQAQAHANSIVLSIED
jgi:hypothetical protein